MEKQQRLLHPLTEAEVKTMKQESRRSGEQKSVSHPGRPTSAPASAPKPQPAGLPTVEKK